VTICFFSAHSDALSPLQTKHRCFPLWLFTLLLLFIVCCLSFCVETLVFAARVVDFLVVAFVVVVLLVVVVVVVVGRSFRLLLVLGFGSSELGALPEVPEVPKPSRPNLPPKLRPPNLPPRIRSSSVAPSWASRASLFRCNSANISASFCRCSSNEFAYKILVSAFLVSSRFWNTLGGFVTVWPASFSDPEKSISKIGS